MKKNTYYHWVTNKNISPTKMVFCHFSEIQLSKFHLGELLWEFPWKRTIFPTNASLERNIKSTLQFETNQICWKYKRKKHDSYFEKKTHRNPKSNMKGVFPWLNFPTLKKKTQKSRSNKNTVQVRPGNSSSPSGEGKEGATVKTVGWVWKEVG